MYSFLKLNIFLNLAIIKNNVYYDFVAFVDSKAVAQFSRY